MLMVADGKGGGVFWLLTSAFVHSKLSEKDISISESKMLTKDAYIFFE